MRLAQAGHLLAQGNVDERNGIARGGVGFAVVDGVNAGRRIVCREGLIEARVPKSSRMCWTGLLNALGDSAVALPWRSEVRDRWRPAKARATAECWGRRWRAKLSSGTRVRSLKTQGLPEAFVVAEEERSCPS